MNATTHSSVPAKADLTTIRVLAALLERLDHSKQSVDAAQYRSVVLHLEGALAQAPSGGELGRILDAHPAAAQLYENMHYAHAGLVRSPLEQSLGAERLARDVIQRAMRNLKEGTTDGQG